MTRFQTHVMVFSVLIWNLNLMGAYPQFGLDSFGRRSRWDLCVDRTMYLSGNLCCLNCPAGTRMVSACIRSGEMGKCEECDDGTYTEFGNSLKQCFKCTQCRSDQEIVMPCTHTQDVECQCRLGRFCAPDEACEVCKKCSRCKKDEKIVRNCTSTADTECKKIQPNPGSSSESESSVIVPLVIVPIAAVIFIVIAVIVCRYRRATDSRRNLPNRLKAGQHSTDPTDERSNGEARRPTSLILSRQLEDEPFPKLVPVNGEQSLRKCFEYLEEIDINHHKRFFRHIGLNDNMIRSKEHLLYEDKIHELLNIWVEKEGREASLNDLLRALLDLNQRRTAETVKEKAIHNGHYLSEDQ